MLAIKGGKVITVTGGVLETGDVLIKDGKIAAVGQNLDIPADAAVIDAAGKWVTPGFIDAHTHLSTSTNRATCTANTTATSSPTPSPPRCAASTL